MLECVRRPYVVPTSSAFAWNTDFSNYYYPNVEIQKHKQTIVWIEILNSEWLLFCWVCAPYLIRSWLKHRFLHLPLPPPSPGTEKSVYFRSTGKEVGLLSLAMNQPAFRSVMIPICYIEKEILLFRSQPIFNREACQVYTWGCATSCVPLLALLLWPL